MAPAYYAPGARIACEAGADLILVGDSVAMVVLGYDLSRTQSILRVATTACPTGGSEVRERMVALEAWSDERWAALVIQRLVRWRRRAARKRAMRRHSSMF